MSEKEAEVTESLEKAKKPRSQKQIETFKKAQEKRKEICELMKQVKEQQDAQRKLEQIKIKEEILKKKVAKPLPPPSVSEEDEPEIVIVKKPKPKKKRIVVVEPESDEEEPEVIQKPREKKVATEIPGYSAQATPMPIMNSIRNLSFY